MEFLAVAAVCGRACLVRSWATGSVGASAWQASPLAATLKLQPGDRIEAVDGKKLLSQEDLAAALRAGVGHPVQLTVSREDKPVTLPTSQPAGQGEGLPPGGGAGQDHMASRLAMFRSDITVRISSTGNR